MRADMVQWLIFLCIFSEIPLYSRKIMATPKMAWNVTNYFLVASEAEFLNVAGMAGSARAIFSVACAKSWVKCAKKGEFGYVCTKFELWVRNMPLNAPLCLITAINSQFLGFYCTNRVDKTLRKICQQKSAHAKNMTSRNSGFEWILRHYSLGLLQFFPWRLWIGKDYPVFGGGGTQREYKAAHVSHSRDWSTCVTLKVQLSVG